MTPFATEDSAGTLHVDQALEFFETLYAGQNGVMELRTFDHDRANALRDFIEVNDGKYNHDRVVTFLKATEALQLGAYYGVALRTAAALKTRKGDAAHCQTLTALFVDADFKHLGEEETRKRIAAFELPPSLVVCSGGGLHPYWLLDQPIFLQAPGGMKTAKSWLKRLASSVADVVDEAVSEPARVLRIPGSFNFKKEYMGKDGDL
ncbi:MAG TPA: hypothetical protein VNJ02_00285 [Vicinamibacterales bacterium]|nr:hypothetical protein [Vicinamibacterales bacterium]